MKIRQNKLIFDIKYRTKGNMRIIIETTNTEHGSVYYPVFYILKILKKKFPKNF